MVKRFLSFFLALLLSFMFFPNLKVSAASFTDEDALNNYLNHELSSDEIKYFKWLSDYISSDSFDGSIDFSNYSLPYIYIYGDYVDFYFLSVS